MPPFVRRRFGFPFRPCALFGVLGALGMGWAFPSSGAKAGDGYPRQPITPELLAFMKSGLPEGLADSVRHTVGSPLPRHVVYSEEQVRWLVGHIQENPLYADHLKYGYFLRRWPGQWPSEAALRLIGEQLDREERDALLALANPRRNGEVDSGGAFVASRSWIRLASVAAFAQMNNPRFGDGMAAYGRLWEQRGALGGDPDVFCRSLGDFTGAIAGRKNTSDNAAVSRLTRMWLPAWLAVEAPFAREPELGRFAEHIGSWPLFEQMIAEAEATLGGRFAFLRRVALFFHGTSAGSVSSSERMAAYLDRAMKTAVFPDQPIEMRRELLNAYADVLARRSQWDKAIDMQCAALNNAEGSLVRVARLCHRAGMARQAGRAEVTGQAVETAGGVSQHRPRQTAERYFAQRDFWLDKGKDDFTRRGEVFDRSLLLDELGRREEAERFLAGFLAAPPLKDAPQLASAVLLASLYVRESRLVEARAVITEIKAADYPPSPETLPHLTRLLAIRAKLADADR